MVDIASPNHVNVLAHVVLIMILFDHTLRDGLHVAYVSQNGQTNLLSLEDPPMCDLDSRFERHGFASLDQFSLDRAPLIFDIFGPVEGVGEHVPHDVDCLRQVLAERSDHVCCVLAGSVGVEIGSHVLDLELKVLSISVFCAFEVQVLQKVGYSARILSLVSAAAFDKHGDATSSNWYLAIFDSMSSEATVIPLLVFDRSK